MKDKIYKNGVSVPLGDRVDEIRADICMELYDTGPGGWSWYEFSERLSRYIHEMEQFVPMGPADLKYKDGFLDELYQLKFTVQVVMAWVTYEPFAIKDSGLFMKVADCLGLKTKNKSGDASPVPANS